MTLEKDYANQLPALAGQLSQILTIDRNFSIGASCQPQAFYYNHKHLVRLNTKGQLRIDILETARVALSV